MTVIMVNGLPGKMASSIAERFLSDNTFDLAQFSLTGADSDKRYWHDIELIFPQERELAISKLIEVNGTDDWISIDYTQPNAVNDNADFYCSHGLDFVMGTTGGDREALEKRVRESNSNAVIAPNMAKQIVAFQAMMKYASETFPNSFKGYSLEILESHQHGKKDTSGTAKAMVQYFNSLGIPFTNEQIKMIRDSDEQMDIGVPEKHLNGHGWHKYTLRSQDGNVLFQFTHNVNGRDVYVDGTLDAVKFLAKKVAEGSEGQVYSMIDVLRGN